MNHIAQWLQEVLRGLAIEPGLEAAPAFAANGATGSHVYNSSADPGGDPNRTVTATRRRRTTSDAEHRETASAPTRDDRPPSSGGSSGGGSGGSSGGSPGGFRMPGGRSGGFSWLVLLAVIAFVVLPRMCGNGGGVVDNSGGNAQQVTLPSQNDFQQDQGAFAGQSSNGASSSSSSSGLTSQSSSQQNSTGAAAAALSSSTATSSSSGSSASTTNTAGGDTWTILLYQDADDKVLEQDINIDLNEAELVGSSSNVKVVAQMDRFRGGYSGDGNWTSTKRFEITQDRDLNQINSKEVQDLGEVNMADGQTLVDFIKWGVENYPADKYALVLSDHGMGWPGGWTDPTGNAAATRNFPLSSALGNMLYLQNLDAALTKARQETGIDKFELIGMDACLMADIAVFTMLADHARYAVASQETEPALGWAYAAYLNELTGAPSESGAALGKAIVASYVDQDMRLGGNRANIAQISQDVTLTAVDLSKMGALNDAFNQFLLAMQNLNPKAIAQARTYAQNFTNVFGGSVPPSYLDLGHFSLLVAQAAQQSPEINASVRSLVEALSGALVAEKSGEGKPGATGMSIYFPASNLYGSAAAGPQSYNVAAAKFVNASLWDEFLAWFYTGRNFDNASVGARAIDASAVTRAPAAGGISISPITLSKNTVSPGETVKMTATVSGENIGYIKYLVGKKDENANSIVWMDSDYLDSGSQKELNGVYYPDWGEGDFTLAFDWEPYTLGINDGTKTSTALFQPQEYGLDPAKTSYVVDGLYTYADGTQLPTKAYFRNDEAYQFFGYSPTQTDPKALQGAPAQVTPSAGDTFTIYENWVDLNQDGSVASTALENGDTVNAAASPLKVEELNLPAGEYIIGFIVEDLDGNTTTSYTPITVK